MTKPCDVGHMGGLISFDNGLGTLKTKSGGGFQGGGGGESGSASVGGRVWWGGDR